MSDLLSRLKASIGDRYEIERELGAGGMATVYLAQDVRHRRHVALKVLRPELAAILGGERFIREIEIAAQIEHPHILTLIDSGDADGILYYVMPYMKGESLRDRLSREGQFPIGDAVRMLRDVADGLAEAHRHGLVHRDIKPDNVMMSGNHAVVMDFGVAKAVSSATGPQNLTTAGIALGTPAYMSPEQAAADPNIDHRTDIYAMGVMGYELLTGRPPFLGASAQEILAAHLTAEPDPVTKHRVDTPPALEAVVMKCLEKRPGDRFQETDEMLRQLEVIATPSGGVPSMKISAATPRAARERRWMRPAIIATAVVVLGLLGLRQVRRSGAVTDLAASLQLALDSGRVDSAYTLLQTSPFELDDRRLESIAAEVGGALSIETEPAGATIRLARALASFDSVAPFVELGRAPIGVRLLFSGNYLVTIELEGHDDAEVALTIAAGDTVAFRRTLLDMALTVDGMVLVEPGAVNGPLADQFAGTEVPAFLIDRHEVSNQAFMAFVSDGGYRVVSLWPDSLLIDDAWLLRERAIATFVDRTGLSGPRDWSGGSFPDGRRDYPVTSVTWYEAAAFARWSGKELPTVEQWWRAALGDRPARFPWGTDLRTIEERSNFSMIGTTRVGSFPFGVSPFGVHDMAGNVREWVVAEVTDDRMGVVGGSWQDPTYMFDRPNVESLAPSFSNEAVGFRLVRVLPDR